jgi:hypothetical protein
LKDKYIFGSIGIFVLNLTGNIRFCY